MVWKNSLDPVPEESNFLKEIKHSTTAKESGVEPPIVQCDYDHSCTLLYKKIEDEEWNGTLMFLSTGCWPGGTSLTTSDCTRSPEEEARIVTIRYDHASGDSTKVCWSFLPLHLSVMLGAPFAIVRRLVDLYPQGVRWANHHGHLPLHLALLFGASDDVVALLLLAYPASVEKTTKVGLTPLQYAMKAESRARGTILATFVHYDNYMRGRTVSSRTVPSSRKSMMPHKGLNCEYESNDCIELYKKIEEGDWVSTVQFLDTGYWDDGSIFARWAPDRLTPQEQVQTWVTRRDPQNKKAVLWRQLSLHLAIICGAPYPVTRRLIELYPQSAFCTDDQGMLPLHLALYYGADDELVAKLLLLFPESVNNKSLNGLTALHYALLAKNSTRGKVIQRFLARKRTHQKVVVTKSGQLGRPSGKDTVVL